MSKNARNRSQVFHSLEDWKAHYMPNVVEAEEEATEPFKEIIAARTAEIIARKASERRAKTGSQR